YFRRSIASWGDRAVRMVNVYAGDINNMSYDGKVEILFIDLAKNRETFRHCNQLFMSRLLPGRSIVFQEDYYHYPLWFQIVYMEMLKDYFVMVDSADNACVFLN